MSNLAVVVLGLASWLACGVLACILRKRRGKNIPTDGAPSPLHDRWERHGDG